MTIFLNAMGFVLSNGGTAMGASDGASRVAAVPHAERATANRLSRSNDGQNCSMPGCMTDRRSQPSENRC